MAGWVVAVVALAYVACLFAVASLGDARVRRRRRAGRDVGGGRPVIYALSLAIYCTSWTFFGSVGLAATSGLDFLGIYLGPILAVTLGDGLMRRVVAIAKAERITSVADFLAARYGKSGWVGALATLIAIVGAVPYIALQLKAISTSVLAMEAYYLPAATLSQGGAASTAGIVAAALAVFAILFGTRHADATEHQSGLVLAVATESVVKLVAFLVMGAWVTLALVAGTGSADAGWMPALGELVARTDPVRLAVFTALSALAYMLLPRQFHVAVVENRSGAELRTARWLFPLYLVAINLFVVPVALMGLATFGTNLDPDLYMLALPLQAEEAGLALLVFVGGLSAATAMVIVACVALAVMVSNNLVLPLVLSRDARAERARGDRTALVLVSRRVTIAALLVLAYLYYAGAGGSSALASIGLLSFAAIAQLAPAYLGGLYWRRANAAGALWGMGTGLAVWAYTLFVPTLVGPGSPFLDGAFGIAALKPQAFLADLTGLAMAPLTHGLVWSLGLNALVFVAASLMRRPTPLERLQARGFVPAYGPAARVPLPEPAPSDVTRGELELAVSRYLGRERARRSFEGHRGGRGDPVDVDLLAHAERLLSSAIGTASARLVIELLGRRRSSTSPETLDLLDRASRAVQYNRDLMQTALDRVDQGIAVFDADYRLSAWNRRFRELTGLPPRYGQVGTRLPELARAIAASCRVDAPHSLERALVEPSTWSLVNPDGRTVAVESRAMPDGGLVVAWNDVTARVDAARALERTNAELEARVAARTRELTRLNEELEAARAAAEVARAAADAANVGKTRFLAAAGHDILQPLNAARLYASSLSERQGEGEGAELARNIDLSLASVEEILGAVLAMSKLDTGALEPDIASVRVADLFERLEVEFRLAAREKGLRLEMRPNDLAVRTDPGLFYRLLQNLVSNAVKYTERGSVTVDAEIVRDRMVFSVTDTGAGIAREDRTRIFGEFTRLEAGKRVAGGLGLGLSIVRRIADSLGTGIELQSRTRSGSGAARGSGTTFKVSLPLAAPPVPLPNTRPAAKVSAPETGVPKAGARLSGLDVLCLDNDSTILDGMTVLLEGWGCRVRTARDGAEAERAVAERAPDVLVADYHLDDETGLDVLDRLRRSDLRGGDLRGSHPQLPAVMLTAERSPALREAARERGAEVLNKPLRPSRLRAVLGRIGATVADDVSIETSAVDA